MARSRKTRLLSALAITALVMISQTVLWAAKFTISAPSAVEDAAIRDGEFSSWNFGGGPMIEVGYMGGIYAEHNCASLIRFDFRNTPCRKVTLAKLRLYKPKDFVQTAPVEVQVFEIAPAQAKWQEGAEQAETSKNGVSWTSVEGFANAGKDYFVPALDTEVAREDQGEWIEFSIPAKLVQKWIDNPKANAGLLIKAAKPGKEWGDHAFFYSSEHYSHKGPQLVVEGSEAQAAKTSAISREKLVYSLPPDGPQFDKWLEKGGRLANFAKTGKMTREQARVFYYFDTTVRKNLILDRYQIPLMNLFAEIEISIKNGDVEAARKQNDEIRKYLLVWEYIRETSWYTAGPLADELSPLQLGTLFGTSIFGRMEEDAKDSGEKIWQVMSGDAMQKNIDDTVRYTSAHLNLTPEQAKDVTPALAEAERLEHDYLGKYKKDLARTQELVKQGADTNEMFEAVKGTHKNHELFLYYQSVFDTPRWTVFVKKAPPLALARWSVDIRTSQYNKARIDSQLKKVKEYGVPEK